MYPDIDFIKQIPNLKHYKRVPVAKEIYADFITPIETLRILKANSKHTFLLESVDSSKTLGRYSFLGFNPQLEISCSKNTTTIKQGDKITTFTNPKETIRKILADYKSPKIENLPPFSGGLVGYFSYDYIAHIESRLDFDSSDVRDFKDLDLMLFNDVIAFDHFTQKIFLITGVQVENLDKSYKQAELKLQNLKELLYSGKKAEIARFNLESKPLAKFSKDDYYKMVQKAKEYIIEGDIFQVVLSNPIRAKASGSLFDVYRALRSSNPSPYMFYLSSQNLEVAGASPETLIKLQDNRLYTYPLAGSRKRGANAKEDDILQEELLSDEKELAEHNMLVDLGRNDLGKISAFNSIKVKDYKTIALYSHVMHISSCVVGEILPDKDALDAIDAILPAGTLSGAPKIRACEIIHELENDHRGIYGGAIGYLDFCGNMDMCIAIRFAYMKDNEVCVRSGAGIVYDSNEESEYQECINKAKAVINALELAHKGLQ